MSFAEGFKNILELSLPEGEGTLKDVIIDCLRECQRNSQKIERSRISEGPVRAAIGFICGRSGRWPYVYNEAMKFLKGKNPMDLLTKRELNSLLNNIYRKKGAGYRNAQKKITQFLTALKDLDRKLKQWHKSERLDKFEHEFERILEEKAKIGRKGIENIIRDCGYMKRIPIDIHEQRFLVRTGIFHKYSSLKRADPTKYDHLAEALRRFCEEELKEIKLNGIILSDAPSVVDFIIWYFSQEKQSRKLV